VWTHINADLDSEDTTPDGYHVNYTILLLMDIM
jgi:hypothetical protein